MGRRGREKADEAAKPVETRNRVLRRLVLGTSDGGAGSLGALQIMTGQPGGDQSRLTKGGGGVCPATTNSDRPAEGRTLQAWAEWAKWDNGLI